MVSLNDGETWEESHLFKCYLKKRWLKRGGKRFKIY